MGKIIYDSKPSSNFQSIYQSKEFNDLNLNDFSEKFKNVPNYQELKILKEIHNELMLSCRLSKFMLDYRGNRINGWSLNEKRGDKSYSPPIGWIGIGLKVIDMYDNNIWIGKNNQKGEWCVAYHGISGPNSNSIKKILNPIIKQGLKPGRSIDENCDDVFHPGNKVGIGVYLTPSIEEAEKYAGKIDINGKNYKVALMLRVKGDKIRMCGIHNSNFWVLNGTSDEIRIYRILLKEV